MAGLLQAETKQVTVKIPETLCHSSSYFMDSAPGHVAITGSCDYVSGVLCVINCVIVL